MNLEIKFREEFRTFVPSVLRDRATEDEQRSLRGVVKLKVVWPTLPALTHIDYSARVQTVNQETNRDYSINVRGEPIVSAPEDAYRCFMRTHIDYLVLGPFLLDKQCQPEGRDRIGGRNFQLD